MTLAHQGNLMSVVGDEDGPLRISFEAKRPTANGVWQDRRITAKAEQLTAHMRRQETRHQISARIEKLTVDNAHAPLERLDIAFTAPVGFFETGPAIGQLLVLDRMTVSQAGVSLIARGRLKLRPAGRLDGTLDLDIVNLAGFVDRMVALGLVAPHEKRNLLLLGGLGAALGGDTQDRLSVPLTFAQGRIRLGPIDIGAAPSWQ